MKILVGYKGTNVGQDLLKLACEYGKAFNSEVAVVTSLIGDIKSKVQEIEKTDKNMADVKKFFEEQGVKCETHVLLDGVNPGEDLVRYAEEHDIDQIIMGVKSRSKVGKLIFGSTAQYVILKAPCPVTTVK